MKIPKMGCAELFLVALIVLTSVMWLRDRLPASRDEIRGVRALAASNEDARRAVAYRLAGGSDLSKGEARRLRERVAAIEAVGSHPVTSVAAQRLAFERERLSVEPFLEMTNSDKFRWMLLGIGRYIELIIGALVGLCALGVTRKRRIRSGAQFTDWP